MTSSRSNLIPSPAFQRALSDRIAAEEARRQDEDKRQREAQAARRLARQAARAARCGRRVWENDSDRSWPTIMQAAAALGVNRSTLSNALRDNTPILLSEDHRCHYYTLGPISPKQRMMFRDPSCDVVDESSVVKAGVE